VRTASTIRRHHVVSGDARHLSVGQVRARRRRGDSFRFVADAPSRQPRRGETFAESAESTNRLSRELWEKGGHERYDQDLLNLGFTKAEARIDDAPLTPGDFPVEGPGPSPFADSYSINEPQVLDLLPLFELETSDPLFDGELSPWYPDMNRTEFWNRYWKYRRRHD